MKRKSPQPAIGFIVHDAKILPVCIGEPFQIGDAEFDVEVIAESLSMTLNERRDDESSEIKDAIEAKVAHQAKSKKRANELDREIHAVIKKAHAVKILLAWCFCF